ncbi:asparagine synthase (glutamine-hydrolyzing) [Pseudomonas otitidis]|uniref:asparagine synthase (glutamine-hydrolyzing) n=1 Tax=Metapseudomonas otitidis TaxID=319939 RepID=UPI00244B0D34|nr:asparagine synthase (glutamine-hydrolyzing) [Pseudomonas otitidis]MDH1109250.1 asparagine synthase (glutamine-hydrolyzing) [Pseudomonas otitidis]MDH1159982.1 asparagine synthase (glutamine-hydrolyzing) [Pseudomonas otitidis]MDH1167410.1 asparagine synthase (glutamine-hydrolyzing) [Pseudomonas otitidis]
MCGITGAFNPQAKVCDDRTLVNMRDRMLHRGPDGAGIWRERQERCVLGHRRLSIIDLSTAATQPMANEDASVVLSFNGEIYNHAELRREISKIRSFAWRTDHSDTEVLLRAYELWGIDCVNRFHGMFAFAIYDARNPNAPILHLARDRAGKKPLYFTRTQAGEWLFASEIRALFGHPAVSPQMEPAAFWHYLTFIVTPAPLTLFKGIFKLPAGHVMTVDARGEASARQYWDCIPSAADIRERTDEQAVSEMTALMRQAIERRMVSDVPFGVLLSGGVDSSLNVALMSELRDAPVTTFSIGYEGEEDTNEFKYARRVAERYRTEHHEMMINHRDAQDFLPELVRLQDEPIADNVCIPLYFLSKLVRERGTTVVQVGEGADENFLGYWWCDHYREKAMTVYNPALPGPRLPWWRRFVSQPRTLLPALTTEDSEIQKRARSGQELFWGGAVCWWGGMRDQLTPDHSSFASQIDCPVKGLLPDSHQGTDSNAVVAHYLSSIKGKLLEPDVLQKIPYLEMKLRLPEHLLMRVDKLTMAHSIEARTPFLDHDIIEFARTLHPRHKLRDGVGKHVLKKAAEPYLDHDMIYRKKQGFGAPMEAWFKQEDFGRRCLAAFERSRLVREGFFDNDYFRDMLKHQMGTGGGYSFHLWTVLNAVLWHESWIEGRTDCF